MPSLGKYILPTVLLVRRREIGSWAESPTSFYSSHLKIHSHAYTHTETHTHIYFKTLTQQKWVFCFQWRISSRGAQMERDGFAAALTPECELRFHCSISLEMSSQLHLPCSQSWHEGLVSAFPRAIREMVGCLTWGPGFHSRLSLHKFGIAALSTAALKYTEFIFSFVMKDIHLGWGKNITMKLSGPVRNICSFSQL